MRDAAGVQHEQLVDMLDQRGAVRDHDHRDRAMQFLQHLRERVVQLEQEQQDSAALIQSLAEQNAVVIRAVEALRLRNQRLGRALVVLGVLVFGVLVWVLRQP